MWGCLGFLHASGILRFESLTVYWAELSRVSGPHPILESARTLHLESCTHQVLQMTCLLPLVCFQTCHACCNDFSLLLAGLQPALFRKRCQRSSELAASTSSRPCYMGSSTFGLTVPVLAVWPTELRLAGLIRGS